MKTDVNGHFLFQPVYLLHHLVAVADQGICGMTIDDFEQCGHILALQPWAEVRGTLRIVNTPVCNSPLEMRSIPGVRYTCGYETYYTTHTDDQGAFEIKKVPPGEFTLLGKTYQVAPGHVLTLDLASRVIPGDSK